MIIKKSSNNYLIKLSKSEWVDIGIQSGWISLSELINPYINTIINKIKKYKNNPDIYIHFTPIPKIGIKPTSKFKGIYLLPISDLFKFIEEEIPFHDENSPFAFVRSRNFIFIVKINKEKLFDLGQFESLDDIVHYFEQNININHNNENDDNEFDSFKKSKEYYILKNFEKIIKDMGYVGMYSSDPDNMYSLHKDWAKNEVIMFDKSNIQLVEAINLFPTQYHGNEKKHRLNTENTLLLKYHNSILNEFKNNLSNYNIKLNNTRKTFNNYGDIRIYTDIIVSNNKKQLIIEIDTNNNYSSGIKLKDDNNTFIDIKTFDLPSQNRLTDSNKIIKQIINKINEILTNNISNAK